jgi:succinyl-CoA synthetase beta subunit
VFADLQNEDDVRDAFMSIGKNVAKKAPEATVNGVLIQKFLPAGEEFIIGGVRDPSFGPLVMVGLGGIYTELFADTSFRVAPVSEEEAYAMLQELSSWKLLLGLRGKEQFDIDALARMVATVSALLAECEINELDLNPVIVRSDGVAIADAKIVL